MTDWRLTDCFRFEMVKHMLVVKIGGPTGTQFEAISAEIAELSKTEEIVLVHGAHDELDRLSHELNHPPQTVVSESGVSSRFTDQKTMELFLMTYCGKVNKTLVATLQKHGVNSVGISAIDGRLAVGNRKEALRIRENDKIKIVRGDYSGKITHINPQLIRLLLDNGFLPVITPPALSADAEPINVDGDRLAAEIAAALQADTLVILSDVPGLLEQFPDENSLIRHIPKERIGEYLTFAQGRMKKKILGCQEALQKGVRRVIIADARVSNPIQHARSGNGTVME